VLAASTMFPAASTLNEPAVLAVHRYRSHHGRAPRSILSTDLVILTAASRGQAEMTDGMGQ
jgi:hypothetical protein